MVASKCIPYLNFSYLFLLEYVGIYTLLFGTISPGSLTFLSSRLSVSFKSTLVNVIVIPKNTSVKKCLGILLLLLIYKIH